MRTLIIILSISLISHYSIGQVRSITGRVVFDDLLPVFDAKIWGLGNVQFGITDFNGDFKIEIPIEIEIVEISFIGMEIATLKIPPICDHLEIILIPDGTYHYKSHKKIDRIRKNQFNDIQKIHLQAFEQGVFTSNLPCYERLFTPLKPHLSVIRNEVIIKKKEIINIFKKLDIGDVIYIPFGTNYQYDGTDRTTLHLFSFLVDDDNFDCIIKGVILDKSKKYKLRYQVTNCEGCEFPSLIFNNAVMKPGQIFNHDMKYFKVLIDN